MGLTKNHPLKIKILASSFVFHRSIRCNWHHAYMYIIVYHFILYYVIISLYKASYLHTYHLFPCNSSHDLYHSSMYLLESSGVTPRTPADHPTRPPRLPRLPRSICDSCAKPLLGGEAALRSVKRSVVWMFLGCFWHMMVPVMLYKVIQLGQLLCRSAR